MGRTMGSRLQPQFKSGAVRIEKIKDESGGQIKIHAPEKQSSAEKNVSKEKSSAHDVGDKDESRERHLEFWVGATYESISQLLTICDKLSERHKAGNEVHSGMRTLHYLASSMHDTMKPIVDKYGENKQFGENVSKHLASAFFAHELNGTSSYEVLIAMQGLYMFISHIESHFTALGPASQAVWDVEFVKAVTFCQNQVVRMQAWVRQQIKVRSPQTLLVPAPLLGKKVRGEDEN